MRNAKLCKKMTKKSGDVESTLPDFKNISKKQSESLKQIKDKFYF